MRPNETKKKFLGGETAYGIMSTFASPLAVETIGHAGYDFVVIDMQHGETDTGRISTLLSALSYTPTIPIVRVPSNMPVYIQRVLDLGAYGVIVPQVNNVEEAKAVVSSVRYAPEGVRSWGPVRGVLYGGPDYFAKAAEELLVLVMIESAEGLANVDAIAALPGVDGLFVGPVDFNISLGNPPLPVAANTEEAIAAVVRAANKAGKQAGIHTLSAEDARKRIAQGFRLVTLMTDGRMMRFMMDETLKTVKG